MRHWSNWKLENKFGSFQSNLEKHFSYQEWYRRPVEKLCRRRRVDVSSSKNVDIKLFITKWNFFYSPIFVLLATGTRICKNTLLRWENFKEKFQQFWTFSSRLKKTKWRQSTMQCSRRDKKLLANSSRGLRIYGQQPTHCDEVPRWQNGTCRHQQYTL